MRKSIISLAFGLLFAIVGIWFLLFGMGIKSPFTSPGWADFSLFQLPSHQKFPETLHQAALGLPVTDAAPWDPTNTAPPMVILTGDGKLHPFHEKLPPRMRSTKVQSTQLLVVLQESRRRFPPQLSPKNQAPINRGLVFQTEMKLIEARTAKVISSKRHEASPIPVKTEGNKDGPRPSPGVSWSELDSWIANMLEAERNNRG